MSTRKIAPPPIMRAIVTAVVLCTFVLTARATAQTVEVQHSLQHDTSIPLRDMVPKTAAARHEEDDLLRIPRPQAVNVGDTVVQSGVRRSPALQAPTVGANFIG